jgi:ubiquinone/menaquinone biosynthesis C-methylase UbiE
VEIPATRNSGILNFATLTNGFFLKAQADRHKSLDGFEKLYLSSRKIENRIYADDQVRKLPLVSPSHEHASEWEIRRRSSERLIRYLENKNKPLQILEVGCGNGWLSHRISSIHQSQVTGIDVNRFELNQAKRVFSENPNLSFSEGDIKSLSGVREFDIIVFAASIQYFYSLDEVMEDAFSILKKQGEIHIMDSFFYNAHEIEKARYRSHVYYKSIGFEEMSKFYFHHNVLALKSFNFTYLYNPARITNLLFGNRHPFAWIRIRKP